MKRWITLILIGCAPFWCYSQAGSEIYLIPIEGSGSTMQLGTPQNITNRAGYDNQPWFSPDGEELLFSSIRADNQADIYSYHLTQGTTRALTQTAESEFSPRNTPDGKSISCVVVEPDSTQRIWQFPTKTSIPANHLRPAAKHIKNIGYYCWIDQENLALMVLTDPFSFQVAAAKSNSPIIHGANTGRCMHPVPGETAASFVDKTDPNSWVIRKYTPNEQQRDLIPTLAGKEDFCWTPEGALLMFDQQGNLHLFNPKLHRQWQLIGPTTLGKAPISRLAMDPSGRYLAVVVAE